MTGPVPPALSWSVISAPGSAGIFCNLTSRVWPGGFKSIVLVFVRYPIARTLTVTLPAGSRMFG